VRTEVLLEILAEAQALGYLGPGDPATHLTHSLGFAETALRHGPVPGRFAALGTGGGVPGLVLAECWPDSRATLIEASARRVRSLTLWVDTLSLGDRVQVVEGRAEDSARDPEHRESYDLVTARSFARPAITAEVAAGLVRPGGHLVVSEPPAAEGRWPEDGVASLGFGPASAEEAQGAHYACLEKRKPAPGGLPRPAGKLRKQPRW
jgi:16S rRNA (guanine527-N7)-methyltransferase